MTDVMTDKERQIAAAALRVFSRYGVKRATMNDVAEEAGVVRQTLYNVFANKDEVIHGTLLFYTEMLREKTLADWAGVDDLGTKIDILFEHNVLAPWDVVRASPDAEEIQSGNHSAAKSALVIAGQEMESLLRDLFAPFEAALTNAGQSPDHVASFVNATMMGLKHAPGERDELVQHLGSLKMMILLATGQR